MIGWTHKPSATAIRPAWGGLLALLVLAGCGGSDRLETYPVKGKLLLDGEPFGPTAVRLMPLNKSEDEEVRTVAGEADENGNLTFTTYERGDGAPAGEYRVTTGLTMAPPPRPFPEVYRKFDESPLTVSIEPKELNEVTIEMDSSAGPPARLGFGGGGGAPKMGEAMKSPGFSAGAENNGPDE